ncbi:hypothetical protein E0E54_00820 [Azotobacter chroococcum]|uniref:hypothetical protein n=1 Tax=Azotobacter chroococcum TaxID=353 RepID=UPI001038F410|nr:hypothetical protein [Azotobacter chroococcum]TBW40152.1 hypothetical protein E0E54_00820 [Azotobacter chroococcum]
MNGALTLTLAALVYLILAAMVMDLFMELIAQLLQSRTTSDPKEDLNSRHPVPSQDEQTQEIPSAPAPAPAPAQDDDPRPPPVSGPPDPIPMSAWLFPLSDYALGVIAVTRFQRPAILPARSGPFLYLICRRKTHEHMG